jgi:hypothetical protein
MMSTNRYIRFVEVSSGLIKESRIPLYSSNYSKKTYTQHQLLVLLLRKEYLAEDYRDTVELTEIMDTIRQKIQLKEVPHFTTIQKFCHRIKSFIFTRLLNRLMKLFYDGGERIPWTAIDSSGFTQFICESLLFMENRKDEKTVSEDLYFSRYHSTSHHRTQDLPASSTSYPSRRKTPQEML